MFKNACCCLFHIRIKLINFLLLRIGIKLKHFELQIMQNERLRELQLKALKISVFPILYKKFKILKWTSQYNSFNTQHFKIRIMQKRKPTRTSD